MEGLDSQGILARLELTWTNQDVRDYEPGLSICVQSWWGLLRE
jgi:hypothetical protein